MYYIIFVGVSLLGIVGIFLHRYILMKKGHKWQNDNVNFDEKIFFEEKSESPEFNQSVPKSKILGVHRLKNLLREIEILLSNDGFKDAEKLAIEALSIEPENEKTLSFLAEIYLKLASFPKAKSIYEDLVLKYQNANYFANLGLCYYESGDLYSALLAYESALAIDKNNKERFVILAKIYEELGDFEKALEKYQKWIFIEPKDIEILLVIADLFERQSNIEEAVNVYERILSLSPYHEVAVAKVAELSRSQVGST